MGVCEEVRWGVGGGKGRCGVRKSGERCGEKYGTVYGVIERGEVC